ncbi:MAG: hypothetical protein ACRDTG_10315 [Pseudonocardiaceae bacterium]
MVVTGGALTLLLAARRQLSTEQTLEHQREVDRATAQDATERRITELYTRAVEQLGAEKAPVRLSGLHALERLAQHNPAQRQTIVDVICAYLRMPYTPPDDQAPGEDAPEEAHSRYEQHRQELQVRLTAQRILAAHLRPKAMEIFWVNLDLDLTGAHLHQLDLTACRRRRAQFGRTEFARAQGSTGRRSPGTCCSAGRRSPCPWSSAKRSSPQIQILMARVASSVRHVVLPTGGSSTLPNLPRGRKKAGCTWFVRSRASSPPRHQSICKRPATIHRLAPLARVEPCWTGCSCLVIMRSVTSPRGRVAATGGLLVLAGCVFFLAVRLRVHGLQDAANVAALVTVVLGLPALAIPLARRLQGEPAPTAD